MSLIVIYPLYVSLLSTLSMCLMLVFIKSQRQGAGSGRGSGPSPILFLFEVFIAHSLQLFFYKSKKMLLHNVFPGKILTFFHYRFEIMTYFSPLGNP